MRLIVIGGGAAGFFCAVNAARMHPGLEVIIVEKTNKILSKVKVSGGGRCNVTHACFSIADIVKKYPRGGHFLKRAFHQFFTNDTIQWFGDRGVALKTEKDGRMFPVTDSSQTIIDCLMREMNRYGVQLWMSREVKELRRFNDQWELIFSNNDIEKCDCVCVACGGYPKSAMFSWLRDIGHSIQEPVPSLFTFNMPGNPVTRLMGVSVEDAQVKVMGGKLAERGPLLITHWGMSGPVVLRLSAAGAREFHERNYVFTILVNWMGSRSETELRDAWQQWRLEAGGKKMNARNPAGVPQRLWDYLLEQSGIDGEMRWSDLPAREQNRMIRHLCMQEFMVSGKTTFKEEFVTAGGISLQEIDPQTMQSRVVPALSFAGEIMDVDGVTGGFNFQHAWTSGYIAAKNISLRR